MNCRHCGSILTNTFVDLGFAPPSNAYLLKEDLCLPEKYYPLSTKICDQCWLVQTEDYAQADELFNDNYAYFSSTSSGWLEHAKNYTTSMIERFSLNKESYIVEIASNDGYLLRNFVASGIPCLGIEPTASTAAAAEILGVPVLREFFGEALGVQLAREGRQADLIIGNNVYAHVPNINDFTRGLKALLKSTGVITLEFPHLLQMIRHAQFDTIYHEHYSYLSLSVVCRIFKMARLRVWHVEQLDTHGGSLRIYGCHVDAEYVTSRAVTDLLREELDFGLQNLSLYKSFKGRAEKIKNNLIEFLIAKKYSGESVAAYGAAAKGNTLLNYAGIKPDLLPYICDSALAKQGKFMPGSHIPILSPACLYEQRPDYVLILPWNIAMEVQEENVGIAKWGGKFVVAVPELQIS